MGKPFYTITGLRERHFWWAKGMYFWFGFDAEHSKTIQVTSHSVGDGIVVGPAKVTQWSYLNSENYG